MPRLRHASARGRRRLSAALVCRPSLPPLSPLGLDARDLRPSQRGSARTCRLRQGSARLPVTRPVTLMDHCRSRCTQPCRAMCRQFGAQQREPVGKIGPERRRPPSLDRQAPSLIARPQLDQLCLGLGLGLRVHGLTNGSAVLIATGRYPGHPTSIPVAVAEPALFARLARLLLMPTVMPTRGYQLVRCPFR